MPNPGHLPIRTCIVCRLRRPKQELLRLALTPETGVIVSDVGQQLGGRGAYACPQCWGRLRFDKRMQRAFRNRARGLAEEPGYHREKGLSSDSLG